MAISLVNALAIGTPYTAASPNYTPSIGTNLDATAYYSSALPLLDLMKSSSGFFAESATTFDTGDQLNLDANGYVTSIPSNPDYDRVGITLLLNNDAAPPNTDYVVSYQGEGTIQGMLGTTVLSSQPGELIVQSAADGSLQLQILSTDPSNTGDYIRDMHVVAESQLPLYQAGLTFNPAFLSAVDNFSTIRFMQWMDTNQIFDQNGNAIAATNVASAPLLTWADRPTLNEATWSHGVPVEALVNAANLAGTDLWVNMPINASDEYIAQFAAYVKANLDPGLKVHVELSNEVWNFEFPQATYAQAQAEIAFGPNGNYMEWYGMRSAQMGSIWKNVFGEPPTGSDPNGRVSVVFNTQLNNEGLEVAGLNTPDWVDAQGNHIVAANYFNEYAVAGYYGQFLSNDSEVATVKGWMTQSDGGIASAIAALAANIQSYNTPLYQYAAAQANAYGLQLVTYESGFGAQTPPSETSDTAYTTFLGNLQRNSAIYNIEQQNIAAFENAGGTLYSNFDAIAAASKFGSWGALESITQTTSPRYQALVDWNAAHPSNSSNALADQNARVYQAGDGGEVVAGTLHGYDVLNGGAGNDVFVAYGSGSSIDGGAGYNTVILPGAVNSYSFVPQADGSISVSGNGETFTIRNIEQIVIGGLATLVPGIGRSLTDANGHVFSFGSQSNGTDYIILRDGVPEGIGSALALVNGVVWDHTSKQGWYSDQSGSWISQTSAPPNADGSTLNIPLGPSAPVINSIVASGQGITAGTGDIHAGAVVTLIANFNQDVIVSGGTPSLLLNDGGFASYTGGSGGTALTFSYAVAAGQNTSKLAVSSVQLNGATVATSGGLAADLTGAATGLGGVLQIDTTVPATSVVTSVVTSGSGIAAGAGVLHAGAAVTLSVDLNSAVAVSGGTPTLLLNDGGVATYTSGSGTAALAFSYTVATGENIADLSISAIRLNGASVTTSASVLAGSGQSLTDSNGHVFSFGGTYSGADHIVLRDGQTVGSGVELALVNGTIWDFTSYSAWYSNNGSSWSYQPNAPTVGLGPTADLSGAVTNPAGLLQISTATALSPTVTSFVASGSGITAGAGDLHVGAVVTLSANMSQAVTVSGGTPTLLLNDGGVATYTGGSGTTALTFSYTVAAGQNTADLTVTGVQLNGATVGVSGGAAADLSGVVTNPAGVLQIDTTSPVVTSVVTSGSGITAGAGDLHAGAAVTLTVNLNQAVTVSGGAPTLVLNDGGLATYTGGSGTAALTFSYTVLPGQNTVDLAVTGIQLKGATVASGGAVADLSGAVTNPAGVLQIDTTTAVPVVASLLVSGSGITAGSGDLHAGGVTLTVNLNQAVTVSGGTPTLLLNDGGVATYTGGSGGTALTFTYTVTSGQNTPDLAVTAVQLNGASVKSSGGATADLSAAVTNPAGVLQIDTTTTASPGAVVTSLLASGIGIMAGAGDLHDGAVLTLTANLSQAVNVSGGTPMLLLNDGGVATYTGGSGSTALTFNYTVGAGDNVADLAVTAVQLNGATVGVSGGAAADLSGAVSNPAGVLQIDTNTPIVKSLVASGSGITAGTGDLHAGAVATLTVVLSQIVSVSGGTPTLLLNDGGVATYTGGSGTTALTFGYTVAGGQNTPDLAVTGVQLNGAIVATGGGTAADLSGAVTNPGGVLQINTSIPTVTSLVASGSGITAGAGDLHTGAVVTLTANLSEAVNVSGGAPTLLLNDGGVATYTGGAGTAGLTFSYTVAAGQNTSDLTVTGVQLNGATVGTGVPTITPGSGQSLTDANGHVFTFGGIYSGSDYVIQRDGLTVGSGVKLALVNGVMWNDTSFSIWYSYDNSTLSWVAQPTPPSISTGSAADLSGAVTNPAGVLQIDTVSPFVTSVAASGSGITAGAGDLHAGAVVTLTVNLSQVVNVAGGTPTLLLNDGGVATYTGGSGTTALTFGYSVAAGQNTPDLTATAVQLNGASVANSGGTAADLSGAVTNPAGVLQIDTISPVVTSLVASGSGITAGVGDLHAGAVVALTANLSQTVNVSGGTPTLLLNDGGVATYTGGSGSAALNFSYTVAAGQNTPDLAVTGVQLNGASVSTSGGATADLNGAVTNPTGVLQIDTNTPLVTSLVASGSGITAGNGDLHAGAVVTLTANLNQAVNVSGGTPTLLLNDGGVATYTGGSGTAALTFSYMVAAGQGTPDLVVTAVQLNGATVGTSVPALVPGSSQSLTDAYGHVFTFGGVYSGSNYFILRDGLTVGSGIELALVNGAVWAESSYSSWSSYNNSTSSWVYQANAPAVTGVLADLSGAVTNPAGVLQIDAAAAPTVTSLVASGSGITAGAGDLHVGAVVTLSANMSQAVTVSGGTPTLLLNDGGVATYTGGSGTTALTFSYTVAAGQNTADLTVTGVQLNGATVGVSGGAAADLSGVVTNPAGVLQIDTTSPVVTSVVTSGSGITAGAGDLHAGAAVTLTVNLNQAVTVSGGTPTLVLNDGGAATYTGGSGTAALTFSYTVAAGQSTPDLAVTAVQLNGASAGTGAPTLVPGSSQSLTDSNGHVFSFGGIYSGSDYFILRDGLSAGSGVKLALVNGTVWDDTSYSSWYSYNNSTSSWTYQPSAPSLGSATIADLSGAVTNPAGVLQIDAASAPTVTSVVTSGSGITAGAGDLHAGAVVALTANLSQAVSVSGGTPTLLLNDGGVATYTGGSGSSALTFSYTVAAGQNTADLTVTAVQLNGATVGISGGATADLSGAVTNPAGVLQIDTNSPVVTSLVASGSGITAGAGDLHAGAVVTLAVDLNQAVTVSGGVPTLLLNDGGVATYTGGSGSAALTFSYTVAAGENTADLAVTAVQLNGASVGTGVPTIAPGSGQSLTDSNGHVFSFGGVYSGSDYLIQRDGFTVGSGAEMALVNGTVWDGTSYSTWASYNNSTSSWVYQPNAPSLGSATPADLSGAVTNPVGVLQIDTASAPYVTSLVTGGTGITAGTGDLHAGAVVTLTVGLSQAVSVSGGTPTLLLNDGGVATYTGGSGSTALTFNYTVAAGENTADLAVTAVQLNGASVGTGVPAITAGSGQSLTDSNGHLFTFGGVYNGADHYILRDGVIDGSGVELVLVNGTVWDETSFSSWASNNNSSWVYQPTAPSIAGVAADLSGVVTNPDGVLQIDTKATQTISGESLSGNSLADITLNNSGLLHVTGGVVSSLNDVSINNGTSSGLTVDSGSVLNLTNSTIKGGTYSNSGVTDAVSGIDVLSPVSFTNTGTLEASGNSTLTIVSGNLTNNGTLSANSGSLAISGSVTGTGIATIQGTNGRLEFGSTSNQNTTFATGASGTLKLDDAPHYTGTIAGLTHSNFVDLANFQFATNPVISSVSGTGAIGTTTDITIQSGTQTAVLHLLNQTANQYIADSSAYLLKDDGSFHHGTVFELHP